MRSILVIAQVAISLAFITLVLLQRRGTGLSSVFGGEGGAWHVRRGLEKFVFWFTVVLAFLFVATSISSLLIAS